MVVVFKEKTCQGQPMVILTTAVFPVCFCGQLILLIPLFY